LISYSAANGDGAVVSRTAGFDTQSAKLPFGMAALRTAVSGLLAGVREARQHSGMSRLERERWVMGLDRWPNLQPFLSQQLPDALLGEATKLAGKVKAKLHQLGLPDQMNIAQEYWDFRRSSRIVMTTGAFCATDLGSWAGHLPTTGARVKLPCVG